MVKKLKKYLVGEDSLAFLVKPILTLVLFIDFITTFYGEKVAFLEMKRAFALGDFAYNFSIFCFAIIVIAISIIARAIYLKRLYAGEGIPFFPAIIAVIFFTVSVVLSFFGLTDKISLSSQQNIRNFNAESLGVHLREWSPYEKELENRIEVIRHEKGIDLLIACSQVEQGGNPNVILVNLGYEPSSCKMNRLPKCGYRCRGYLREARRLSNLYIKPIDILRSRLSGGINEVEGLREGYVSGVISEKEIIFAVSQLMETVRQANRTIGKTSDGESTPISAGEIFGKDHDKILLSIIGNLFSGANGSLLYLTFLLTFLITLTEVFLLSHLYKPATKYQIAINKVLHILASEEDPYSTLRGMNELLGEGRPMLPYIRRKLRISEKYVSLTPSPKGFNSLFGVLLSNSIKAHTPFLIPVDGKIIDGCDRDILYAVHEELAWVLSRAKESLPDKINFERGKVEEGTSVHDAMSISYRWNGSKEKTAGNN